jgi:tRNA threonylcarbamoyladenosine biosynthesis protein TsaB
VEERYMTTPAELARKTAEKTLFCGEIPDAAIDLLKTELGGLAVIPDAVSRFRRPGYLAKLAWQRFAAGQADDAAALQPVYLRLPPITERKVKTVKK